MRLSRRRREARRRTCCGGTRFTACGQSARKGQHNRRHPPQVRCDRPTTDGTLELRSATRSLPPLLATGAAARRSRARASTQRHRWTVVNCSAVWRRSLKNLAISRQVASTQAASAWVWLMVRWVCPPWPVRRRISCASAASIWASRPWFFNLLLAPRVELLVIGVHTPLHRIPRQILYAFRRSISRKQADRRKVS
jgi:hypothetical protein